MSNGTTLFSGEVQLASWKETHNGGATVTIWLADPEQLESFRRMTERKNKVAGQRLGMVLVEINDDETLVVQPEPAKPPKGKLGPLGLLAVQLCENPLFQKWIAHQMGPDDLPGGQGRINASLRLKLFVGIASRKELDTNPDAAQRFEEFVRKPFVKYQELYR